MQKQTLNMYFRSPVYNLGLLSASLLQSCIVLRQHWKACLITNNKCEYYIDVVRVPFPTRAAPIILPAS